MGALLRVVLAFLTIGLATLRLEADTTPAATAPEKLAEEIKTKGWIIYCARADNGNWELFASRPDGSEGRNVTNTPDYEEAGPMLSRDGQKLLYRRLKKESTINHDLWGFQGELMLANADGSEAVSFGKDGEYSWASWSPDGKQLLCLTRKEIQVIDIATKQIVRTLPRKGIYQQLFWSPDGRWFTGTANHKGAQWCVVRMNAESGEVNPIITFQSCTPDWCPDSERIIFSSRPAKQLPDNEYGWTQLYVGDGEGKSIQLVYGEDGVHIYGGALSPDGAYAIFTRCPNDGGGAEKSGAPICIIKMSDAPVIGAPSPYLETRFPQAKHGSALILTDGWEPTWTYEEVFASK